MTITGILSFLLLIGTVVLVHEGGHFIVAKLGGIPVRRFSVGFGKPLWTKRWRGTDYQIGRYPLGGFVKLGDFHGSSWKMLAVIAAGPAANVFFALFLFFPIYFSQTERPGTTIGAVSAQSPAELAGLQAGDLITHIDGVRTRYWRDIEKRVRPYPSKEILVRVKREGDTREFLVTPSIRRFRSRMDMASKTIGYLGIVRAGTLPAVGLSDTNGAASQAGFQNGDLIVAIDGTAFTSWGEAQERLHHRAKSREVVILRGKENGGIPRLQFLEPRLLQLDPEAITADDGKRTVKTGLVSVDRFVRYVEPGSPAQRIGMRRGDIVETLDGQPVSNWGELDERLLREVDKTFTIGWRRPKTGEVFSGTFKQVRVRERDLLGNSFERLVFGARNESAQGGVVMARVENRFRESLTDAMGMTGTVVSHMAAELLDVIRGHTPSESIGGALTMYRATAQSQEQGPAMFAKVMAFVSINLALLNLLPLPILDGGHFLLVIGERLRGRPVSRQALKTINWVGLTVITSVTLFALRNDLMRLF